jgi:carbamoyltransferase
MIILGLNAYHGDSGACLVKDGQLVCAIEEERIKRKKHWAGMPVESIKWCLDDAGIKIEDVDYIAIPRNPSAHFLKRIWQFVMRRPSLGFLKDRLQNVARVSNSKADIVKGLGINVSQIRARVVNVEHHRAHIASAFLVSPFESAVCVSVDGFGDFVSTMRGVGQGNKIKIIDWVGFPHSLGIFYTALTQFLGFEHYGDEYKVMGLSAMGQPKFLEQMRKIIRLTDDGLFKLDVSYFLHAKEGVDMLWKDQSPFIGRIFSDNLIELFGPVRKKEDPITQHHKDIAASLQAIYEEAYFYLLNDIYKKTKINNLVLTGGCIQNSLANGKIFDQTPFKEVYVPPAAHDAGTAIGAAFWIWNCILGNPRSFIMDKPYWGPEFSDEQIEIILKNQKINFEKLGEAEIIKRTAVDIMNGKIVGWFQGRTEWGPRALGNRSILVDPRNDQMKDILNERIKRRENFRPFAPVILQDQISEWFERSYPVPFMERVYKIKPEKRKLIPAVTHVDGTGRLQTISQDMNPRYYQLIKEFYRLTNVPILLNTSFNENEPIVNIPEDALNCFLRTKMEVLVLGNYYIKAD